MFIVDAQQVSNNTFKALINEDYSTKSDIDRSDRPRECIIKRRFLAGTRIYMLRSNLRLNIGKAVGYNNKILIRNTDMKTGSNKDINKDVVCHQKSSGTPPEYGRTECAAHAGPKMYLMKGTDKSIKYCLLAQHEQTILLTDNLKMLTEKHTDEKLAITILIVGTGLIA